MVNVKRFWVNFINQPYKHKTKIEELKSAVKQAIEKSETQHHCEIVFVIEDSFSLAWIFASLETRVNYLFKKMKLNKLENKKGILIYLSKIDDALEIRVGEGVKIPKDNWKTIIELGVSSIQSEGVHQGCLDLIEMITNQLLAYEPNEKENTNLVADELILK